MLIQIYILKEGPRSESVRLGGSDPKYYLFLSVFRIRIQLNPHPAKNLNPDPGPEDLESGSGS